MARGDRITSVDYNTIRSEIVSILGTGSGQRGYGQKIDSSAVTPGAIITENQWDRLRNDIVNAKLHQDGELPSLINVSQGQVIQYGESHPNTRYSSVISQVLDNKFNIEISQAVIVTPPNSTQSKTGLWITRRQATFTVTFDGGYTVTNSDLTSFTATGADHARHFFNSGGKIRINSTRTEGTNTPQNNAWTALLSSIGTQEFGASIPASTNFYTLTNFYQTFYQRDSITPYANTFYKLEALCNCTGANNSTGTANTVTFRITWNQGPDAVLNFVGGTLTVNVSELKASGNLIQGGNFSIVSPSYSSIIIEDVDPPSIVYNIAPSSTTVNEGSSVTFTVTTTNLPNGTTLYWTTSSTQGNTAASDFTDGLTSGSLVINNNSGTIIRQISQSDGVGENNPSDKFRIELRTESTSGSIVATSLDVEIIDAQPTYTIVPSASSVLEGSSVTFTVTTTNVLNGTVLYWTTASTQNNTNSSDFADNTMSGTVTINNNIGTITRTLVANDGDANPNDKFTISIRTGSVSGPIQATSSQVEIIDVSVSYAIAPNISTVNEGGSVVFTVTTTSLANGTILYWTQGGTASASDFLDSATSGTVTINGNSGNITRTLRNDLTTEGSETLFLRLRIGSTSGTIVATSTTVLINDTSIAPAGQQEFTTALGTDYTFNVPAGVTRLNVVIVGGGGGGGYSNRNSNSNDSQHSGGGGGSGGYYTGVITVPENSTVLGIRVGSRGLGAPKNPQGSNSTGVTSPRLTTELLATDGGDSYITLPGVSPSATPFKATGGKRGGNAVWESATPGTAGASGLPAGGAGTAGQTIGNSQTKAPLNITGTAAGGQGGSNPLGIGGAFAASNGNAGTGYGAGGSGAGVNQVSSNRTEAAYAGGNGTGGYIKISWG